MPGQVRAPFHWRVKFPHILVSIVRQMPLAQSASQVEASLPRTLLGKGRALTQNTKRLLSCRCSSPHPPTSLPCRKLWRLLPPLQCMGMVTTQSSHAQCGVPNFPIVRERLLFLILRLKLPGNVAHGDHTQHAHSARPHTMASLPAHPGPAETPSNTLLIVKIGKTCHVSFPVATGSSHPGSSNRFGSGLCGSVR